jgi:hypothetical protein
MDRDEVAAVDGRDPAGFPAILGRGVTFGRAAS